jgi:hypothetical protein
MVFHVIWNAIFRSNYDIPEIALSGRAALWVHFLYTFTTLFVHFFVHFWHTSLWVLEGISEGTRGHPYDSRGQPNGSKGNSCGY